MAGRWVNEESFKAVELSKEIFECGLCSRQASDLTRPSFRKDILIVDTVDVLFACKGVRVFVFGRY